MLLAVDVGNTNTVLGVFQKEELVAHWRLTTARDQTVDEYGILTRNLFTLGGLDPTDVHNVIISSVVPTLNETLEQMAERWMDRRSRQTSGNSFMSLPSAQTKALATIGRRTANSGNPTNLIPISTTTDGQSKTFRAKRK